MLPAEKAEARQRQGKRTDLDDTSAKLSQKSPERTTAKIGAIAGVSGRTGWPGLGAVGLSQPWHPHRRRPHRAPGASGARQDLAARRLLRSDLP